MSLPGGCYAVVRSELPAAGKRPQGAMVGDEVMATSPYAGVARVLCGDLAKPGDGWHWSIRWQPGAKAVTA